MGILFTASTMSLAQAFRDAGANVVAPVFFFQLIWTVAIGYVGSLGQEAARPRFPHYSHGLVQR